MIKVIIKRISIVFLISIAWVSVSLAEMLYVEIENTMLNLSVENVSLKTVLTEIEKQSNIQVTFMVTVEDTLTTDLTGISLEDGLKLLLKNYDHSLEYTAVGKGEEQKLQVSSVFIYSRSGTATDHMVVQSTGAKIEKKELVVAASIIPEIADNGGSMDLRNSTPVDDNPMLSMKGVDPLMRYDTERPHSDVHDQGDKFLPPLGQYPVH